MRSKKRIGLENEEKIIMDYVQNKLRQPLTHRVLQNFPPESGLIPGNTDISFWLEKCSQEGRDIHIYIAIPFCTYKGVDKNQPEKCGFCLLPTVPYSSDALLQYMKTLMNYEIPKYAEYLGSRTSIHSVDSIFLGGGTPNIMDPNLYAELLGLIRKLFKLKPEVEITTEGTPELYTFEKLKAFKESGGTRVSFGVQQFNEDLLPLCGRNIEKEKVKKVVCSAIDMGFSVSIDLIYGWPDQTLGKYLSELKELIQIGVPRITAYPLNINRTSYFSTAFDKRLPDLNKVMDMYILGRELLLGMGYEQVTLNDFEKLSIGGNRIHYLRHEHAMRNDHLSYRIGFGYAAHSKLIFFRDKCGITYRNKSNREEGLNRYLDCWRLNQFPVESFYLYSPYDLMLNYISGALQTFRIDLREFNKFFPEIDFVEEFDPVLNVFQSMKWMQISNNFIEISPAGRLFTHILQGAFFNKRVEQLMAGKKDNGEGGMNRWNRNASIEGIESSIIQKNI